MYEIRQYKTPYSRQINIKRTKQRVQIKDIKEYIDRKNKNVTQKKETVKCNLQKSQLIQRLVLTRSQQKIVNITNFASYEDMETFYNTFKDKYSCDIVLEMINRILNNFTIDQCMPDDMNDNDDECGANISYHTDLNEYDDPYTIDSLASRLPIQMARKPYTKTGPKNYQGKCGYYSNISYITGDKGDIDFNDPNSGSIYTNTVVQNSDVDLIAYIPTIGTKNRQLHFAAADKLYANKNNMPNASWTTNIRKGHYTWHHMRTPYHMVLVDMVVHRMHGHNGGVYLW